MQIGFIGTGVMGGGMARCLIEGGFDLVVHDAYREATTSLQAMGAKWGANPREVAEQCDLTITSLPGPAEAEAVFYQQPNGILAGLKPGHTYLDTSTSSPALARRIATACREKGGHFLDAPVSGRPPKMSIMVGGEPEVLDRYRPALQAMSRDIFYFGDNGQGMVAKSINQFLMYANIILASEGLLLAAKAGLDPELVAQMLSVSGASRFFPKDIFENIVFPRNWERVPAGPGPLDRWVKDVGCAQETALAINAHTPLLTIVQDTLKRAQAQGWGDLVNFVGVRAQEQAAGVELRGKGAPGA
ncbi:MAG: NAD(P)-dependent oxidoreductase [Dehalococcoidia bacterium]|nr:NAD(P)-dependent oxidoreductase [Dehalococcoidia bacterium]